MDAKVLMALRPPISTTVKATPSARIPLQDFTLFPKLPLEIRLLIWRLSMPRSREIDFEGFCHFEEKSGSPTPRLHGSTPACFRVNRESRQEVQKHYLVLEGFVPPPPAPQRPVLSTRDKSKRRRISKRNIDPRSEQPLRLHLNPELDTIHLRSAHIVHNYDGCPKCKCLQNPINDIWSCIQYLDLRNVIFDILEYNHTSDSLKEEEYDNLQATLLQMSELRLLTLTEDDPESFYDYDDGWFHSPEVYGTRQAWEQLFSDFFERNIKHFKNGVPEVALRRYGETAQWKPFPPPTTRVVEDRGYDKWKAFWLRDEPGRGGKVERYGCTAKKLTFGGVWDE